jgi:class 3 adenylate cyclase
MDVERWLAQIGLPQYRASFLANDIDAEVLRVLDETDLEKLGVTSLGHRKRLLGAIQALKEPARARSLVEAGALAQPRAPERRQLTVMFCDLVGSTALSERLDPEDFRDVIRAYQDCCAGVVTRFEGYVAKYLGDGVLIYFGYPRAHEDDAERAVRAALAIRSGIEALTTKAGDALAVRLGLATGMVVVGDIIGAGSSQEEAVVGETPNLAARLQKIAGPNGIVISAATRDLIGQQFACHDLGSQALKGISRPIHAWQVTAERPIETRFRAAHSDRLTTFVGREQELRCLHDRWRQAVAGQGQVVLLSGSSSPFDLRGVSVTGEAGSDDLARAGAGRSGLIQRRHGGA